MKILKLGDNWSGDTDGGDMEEVETRDGGDTSPHLDTSISASEGTCQLYTGLQPGVHSSNLFVLGW